MAPVVPGRRSHDVDEIEDAKFPNFNKAKRLSTGRPHLIETKHVENSVLSAKLETALGTVDRFPLCGLFSFTYKIDHLSKQQVVAFGELGQHCAWRLSLMETSGTLILSFNYIRWGLFGSCPLIMLNLSEFQALNAQTVTPRGRFKMYMPNASYCTKHLAGVVVVEL